MTIAKPTEFGSAEVTPKVTRRSFTKEYKLPLLERVDRCKGAGEIGRLLRQEGLYSSHLSTWRAQCREGTLVALARKRGPTKSKTDGQLEVERLRRDNERLRKKLARAEKIIDVQKNYQRFWGSPSTTTTRRAGAADGRHL